MVAEVSVKVKHMMSSPVVTVDGRASVLKAARMMDRYDIGSLIVVDKTGNPVGILTDMDIVRRVVARNLKPRTVKVESVMSKPLVTVDQEEDLTTVARVMRDHQVKRLGVMYKGKLVGVVSSKDIAAITPELLEVLSEKERVSEPASRVAARSAALVGYCELCGEWSDYLREKNGSFLCESCFESE